jgi:membrane-bound lytic murein transglycosylase B
MATLRSESPAKGVSTASFDRLTSGLTPDMSVLEFLDYQPEFRTPIWDYLAGLVDDERVADALAMREKWAGTLAAAAERYQVDADTVIAVWGVESNFGRNFGKRPLLTSLGTLACFGRRQAYFRGEFLSTLKILDSRRHRAGAPGRLVGRRFRPHPVHAVDLPAAGRRWRRRRPARPDGQRPRCARLDRQLPAQGRLAQRRALGLRGRAAGRFRQQRSGRATSGRCRTGRTRRAPCRRPADRRLRCAAGLLLPAGPRGPAFLVFRNFDAIYGYNAAESYALAIAHLADRIKGGPSSPLADRRPRPVAAASAANCKRCSPAAATRSAKSTA